MHKCKYCGKQFPTGVKLGGHVVWCKNNPKREETCKKISEKLKINNPSFNPENREKISKTIRKKVKNNEWHLSFSKSRIHEYKGEKFHGKWELEYAKYLDKEGINWRRPNEKFPYIFEKRNSFYTPDFYLIDEKKYVEIKGYPTKKDFSKWDQFPLDLKIISGPELQKLGIIEEYKSCNITYKQYSWK